MQLMCSSLVIYARTYTISWSLVLIYALSRNHPVTVIEETSTPHRAYLLVGGQTVLDEGPVLFWWLEQITYLEMFSTYLEARNCSLPNFKLLQRGAILNSKMAAKFMIFFFADRMWANELKFEWLLKGDTACININTF